MNTTTKLKNDQFSRTTALLGVDGMEKLRKAKVLVVGLGGVGGYAVEALVRAGIFTLGVCDDDRVCITNLNRQLHATTKTVGQIKTDAVTERILSINNCATVNKYPFFYNNDTSAQIDICKYDYVIDAIDTIACKLELIENAKKASTPIISCMSAGNKLDPTAFEVADIFTTSVCPIAKVMRSELKKRGIEKLKVVYSKEPTILPPENILLEMCNLNCVCPSETKHKCTVRRQIPASISFVPSVAGLILAGEVIKDLTR
ncbi:MAG: tRNA threonylcarbamoyladenosine dehydratase [Firmicutes bacterium]|nr:tRNA threonylcarbamoyladenosine dehydratase [Bacillota bacterium]